MRIKNIFTIFFALGSVIAIAGNIYHNGFIAAILSVGIMILYYFVGSQISRQERKLSSEQFADSNYYLGFLLTLVSLSASLFWMDLEANSLDYAIGQFGVALITTLVGLFLRIYIIGFKHNNESNRENFEEIVGDKLHLISNIIEETVNKNALFSKVLDEKINIFNDNTIDMLDKFSKNLTVGVDASVDELSKTIKGISTGIKEEHRDLVIKSTDGSAIKNQKT